MKLLIYILVGIASGVLVDVAFWKMPKKNRKEPFSFEAMGGRAFAGALSGFVIYAKNEWGIQL